MALPVLTYYLFLIGVNIKIKKSFVGVDDGVDELVGEERGNLHKTINARVGRLQNL